MATPSYRAPAGSARTPLGMPAMIVGIVSIPAVILIGLGGLSGLVAIGLGIADFRNRAKGRPSNRTQATVGIACGALAFLALIFFIARPDS